MGLLDDAIREHLELKRRRGADAGDISRQESEALGPVQRGPDGAPDLPASFTPPDEPTAEAPAAPATYGDDPTQALSPPAPPGYEPPVTDAPEPPPAPSSGARLAPKYELPPATPAYEPPPTPRTSRRRRRHTSPGHAGL